MKFHRLHFAIAHLCCSAGLFSASCADQSNIDDVSESGSGDEKASLRRYRFTSLKVSTYDHRDCGWDDECDEIKGDNWFYRFKSEEKWQAATMGVSLIGDPIRRSTKVLEFGTGFDSAGVSGIVQVAAACDNRDHAKRLSGDTYGYKVNYKCCDSKKMKCY